MSRSWLWGNSKRSLNTRNGLSENGISEREEGRFSELNELVCACWRIKAEIEFVVGLVLEEGDVCICLDLKLQEPATVCEEDVDVIS